MTMFQKSGNGWSETRDLAALEGGAFRRVQKAYVQDAGEWKEFYTYVPTIRTELSVTAGPPSTVDAAFSIAGRVKEQGTDAVPPQGSKIELLVGDKVVQSATTNADGTFSLSWTPSAPGGYSPTVRFVDNGYWESASKLTGPLVFRSAVRIETNPLLAPTIGVPLQFSGDLTSVQGATVSGRVQLYVRARSATTWDLVTQADSTDGSYNLSWTPPASLQGDVETRLQFLGNDRFAAAQSLSLIKIYQPTPAAPEQTVAALTNGTLRIDVTDQPNVNRFVVTCIETGNAITKTSTGVAGTKLSTNWGLRQNTTYTFKVVAYSNNPTKGSVEGKCIEVTTGQDAARDRGSSSFVYTPSVTGSWRQVDGWKYLGSELAQGYYTQSYGPYTGVATFDLNSMRTRIDSYGTARSGRWKNVSCDKFEVYLTRNRAGWNAAQPIWWYLTGSVARSGGKPELIHPTASTPAGLKVDTSGWLTIADATYGDKLLSPNHPSLSVAMHDTTSNGYSKYAGGTGFKIRVTYSWDWAYTSYTEPTWRYA